MEFLEIKIVSPAPHYRIGDKAIGQRVGVRILNMGSRAPEGYEALPEGADGPPLPQPQAAARAQAPAVRQPQQPLLSSAPAAGVPPAPAPGEPALGVSAFPQPAPYGGGPAQHPPGRQQQGASFHSFPPYLQALPPSAEQEWDGAAVVMSVWLGTSLATLTLSLLTFNLLATIAAVCGAVGAATHRFPWFRPAAIAGDLSGLVSKVFGLAIACASLSCIVAGVSILTAIALSAACGSGGDPGGCAELTEATLLYGIWFAVFSALSIAVIRRTNKMRTLLNPVSSGLVNI